MASRTPTKKRATPASARVTDSSKKSGKKFGGFAYAGADAAPRRALNFVDDGSASDDDDIFVPVATHKLVGYKREGETEPKLTTIRGDQSKWVVERILYLSRMLWQ